MTVWHRAAVTAAWLPACRLCWARSRARSWPGLTCTGGRSPSTRFHRPEETAAALTSDGWLRTGDGGYVDEEGYLFLTDRVKDMIITGGENVYPIEVEEVLAQHPDVADVAVIGVPDERWGEAVKALVIVRDDRPVSGAALLAFARERLAGYKLPRSIDFVDDLPRTPTGKVLKRELRERYLAGQA